MSTCLMRIKFAREIEVPEISQRIKEARIKSKVSSKQLAEAVNITRGYLYQIENDSTTGAVSWDVLKSIASFLDIDLGLDPKDFFDNN